MASPAATVRDRAPLPAVYLHQLYRDPEPDPEPEPRLPLVRRELLFLCGALKWCILAFVFVASFLVLMWMIFHPTFPQMNVASASMSAVAVTATAASAECNITLVLTNPNRHLTAAYDRMEISLLYASQQVPLSQFHQPRIVQPKRSQITFQTNLSFSGVNLGSGVVSAMKQDLDRGSLGLMIKIFSVIKYRNGKWKTKSRYMRAYCGGVSFGFTSSNRPGIFLNPYQECERKGNAALMYMRSFSLKDGSSSFFKVHLLLETSRGKGSDHETSWFVTPNKRDIIHLAILKI